MPRKLAELELVVWHTRLRNAEAVGPYCLTAARFSLSAVSYTRSQEASGRPSVHFRIRNTTIGAIVNSVCTPRLTIEGAAIAVAVLIDPAGAGFS